VLYPIRARLIDSYIVKRLNRQKIQTRRGKPWHRMTIRAILKRRDFYRPYLKEIMKPAGRPVKERERRPGEDE